MLLLVLVAVTAVQAGEVVFEAENTQGFPPLEVRFHDVSTIKHITSHSWDFGDGTTSTDANPTHAYMAPGTYTVTLRITAPDGEKTGRMDNLIAVYTSRGEKVPPPIGGGVIIVGVLAAVGVIATVVVSRRWKDGI